MNSEDKKKAAMLQKRHIKFASKFELKQGKKGLLQLLILALIVVVAFGLYLLKNPIGKPAETTIDPAKGEYASVEFALDVTNSFDLDKILSYDLPVIIDFGADTCVPCKEMAPVLLELNKDLRGKAIVKFVDVWKNNKAAAGLPLEVIPTQFFFNADGTPYKPADEEKAAKIGFIMYQLKDSGKHVYTVHQGGLDKVTILAVLKEMGMK